LVVVVVVVVVPPPDVVPALAELPLDPSVVPSESPVSTLPEQPAVATMSPSRMAPAVRGTVPSARRSGAPQWGHAVAEGRAWQLQEGQAISVSSKYMPAIEARPPPARQARRVCRAPPVLGSGPT